MKPYIRCQSAALVSIALTVTTCTFAAPAAWSQGDDDDGGPTISKATQSLSFAARDGNIAKVKALLAQGVDINARGAGRHTALMAAAAYGETEMVRFLLSQKANPNLKDAEGRTALDRARDTGKIAVVAILQPVTTGKAGAAPVPAPRPVPATPPRPAPAKPAAPNSVGPVRLPRLAPRPGFVTGRAVFADGRPIPAFTAEALGFYGELHFGPTGTLPFLGSDKATSGIYAIETRDYAFTRKPVNALVCAVKARAHLTYRGKKYSLTLHPLDGKINGSDPKGFRGQSRSGVVRDFVLKISGTRPGYESYATPKTSREETGLGEGSFYGGSVSVNLYEPNDTDLTQSPPGTAVTLTFTPLGSLIDGSAGGVVTRTYRFAETGYINSSFMARDIPLGAYTVTAALSEPGGNSYPLRLKIQSTQGEWQPSQVIEFEPYSLEFDGKVENVRLRVTR